MLYVDRDVPWYTCRLPMTVADRPSHLKTGEQMREPERRITRDLKSTSTAAARLRWTFVGVGDRTDPEAATSDARYLHRLIPMSVACTQCC